MSVAARDTGTSAVLRLALPGVCWLCALLVGATGCRTGRDNQIDLLERELRTQEDYIYELEDYVCQYSEKLRQCRCSQTMVVETKATQPRSVVKKSKPAGSSLTPAAPLQLNNEPYDEPEPTLPAPRDPSRRKIPPATVPETSPENLEAPELEIGDPVGQVERDARVLPAEYSEAELLPYADETSPIDEGISALPPTEDELVEAAQYEELIQAESARVPEEIVVTHLFRGQPGDASPTSLLAVIELRDQNDEPVESDGAVSLMVMTADAEKPRRLKRWDFTAVDASSAWQTSHLGDGLHLELPLEETELPAVPLELWVRVVNSDGSKLLAQLPFERKLLVTADSVSGDADERLAQQEVDSASHNSEGRLLSAEEPVADEAETPSGWKPSLVRSDSIPTGVAPNQGAPSGWIAQPPGGRFPGIRPAAPESKSPHGPQQPIWTAGRVTPASGAPAEGDSKPRWSPYR